MNIKQGLQGQGEKWNKHYNLKNLVKYLRKSHFVILAMLEGFLNFFRKF